MVFGMYTTNEASMISGISVRTLRNYVKEGKLHPKFLGRSYYFTEEDLKSLFLDSRPNAAKDGKA